MSVPEANKLNAQLKETLWLDSKGIRYQVLFVSFDNTSTRKGNILVTYTVSNLKKYLVPFSMDITEFVIKFKRSK